MSEHVNPIPPEYAGVIPYLVVRGGSDAIAWYRKVFGAEELLRLAAPDGSIGHAEMRIGGGRLMLADEVPDMDIRSPATIGDSGTGLMLYVQDAEAVFKAAIDAGGKAFKPICQQFYGELSGTVDDPFGHRWTISQRIENIDNAEIKRRFDDLYGDD